MSHVAVTGAAGPVGRRLLDVLVSDPTVERVVAIDREHAGPDGAEADPADPGIDGVVDGSGDAGKIEFRRMQLRDGDIDAAFEGVDTVVHLAGSDPLEDRDVDHDLHTTARILAAVQRSGVTTVIARTSATVYGAWNDNPVPMSETAPLRPNDESDWVKIRVQIEGRLAAFAQRHPEVAVAVVRPCVTVSEEGPDELGRVLAAARMMASNDDAAPAQFVHADDVVAALEAIRDARATGAYNVAPDGALDPAFVRALVGPAPRLPMSESVARRLTAFGWRYQLAPTPPGFVPFVVHPWVVANDRLRELGWEPAFANEEAFVAGHDAAPWAAISPQRRQEIALGIAGVALAAVGGAGVLVARRLRR